MGDGHAGMYVPPPLCQKLFLVLWHQDFKYSQLRYYFLHVETGSGCFNVLAKVAHLLWCRAKVQVQELLCYISLRTFLQSIYHWPSRGSSSIIWAHLQCHISPEVFAWVTHGIGTSSSGHGLYFCNLSFSRVISMLPGGPAISLQSPPVSNYFESHFVTPYIMGFLNQWLSWNVL